MFWCVQISGTQVTESCREVIKEELSRLPNVIFFSLLSFECGIESGANWVGEHVGVDIRFLLRGRERFCELKNTHTRKKKGTNY